MALTHDGVPAIVARRAVAMLIAEEMQLRPIALVLRKCREVRAGEEFPTWACPACRSDRVAGVTGGPGLC
jgi:hypothetical protein